MECPMCGGSGCKECNDGRFALTCCPKRFAAGGYEWVELADMLDHGLPPVAGGALDQSHAFIEAARFVWSEQRGWKNRLGVMW